MFPRHDLNSLNQTPVQLNFKRLGVQLLLAHLNTTNQEIKLKDE